MTERTIESVIAELREKAAAADAESDVLAEGDLCAQFDSHFESGRASALKLAADMLGELLGEQPFDQAGAA
jgi:hypothetical protein